MISLGSRGFDKNETERSVSHSCAGSCSIDNNDEQHPINEK